MYRVRQCVFVSTSTPTHIYISLTMYTEHHDFTLTYPIPINTTGFILVFSSTFVTHFADTDKSGCQSLMYLFIWSVSLDVTDLLSLPPLWTLLYSSHSASGSLHWVVLTWMPSLPSLDLTLSIRNPAHVPIPSTWIPSSWDLITLLGHSLQGHALYLLGSSTCFHGTWTCHTEQPLYGDASSACSEADTHPEPCGFLCPSTHTFFTLPYLMVSALNYLGREEEQVGFWIFLHKCLVLF